MNKCTVLVHVSEYTYRPCRKPVAGPEGLFCDEHTPAPAASWFACAPGSLPPQDVEVIIHDYNGRKFVAAFTIPYFCIQARNGTTTLLLPDQVERWAYLPGGS